MLESLCWVLCSPTWLLHHAGNGSGGQTVSRRCYADVPVLLRAQTLCRVCQGRARVVRELNAWTLSMLLSRAGLLLHTYPQVCANPSNPLSCKVEYVMCPAIIPVMDLKDIILKGLSCTAGLHFAVYRARTILYSNTLRSHDVPKSHNITNQASDP